MKRRSRRKPPTWTPGFSTVNKYLLLKHFLLTDIAFILPFNVETSSIRIHVHGACWSEQLHVFINFNDNPYILHKCITFSCYDTWCVPFSDGCEHTLDSWRPFSSGLHGSGHAQLLEGSTGLLHSAAQPNPGRAGSLWSGCYSTVLIYFIDISMRIRNKIYNWFSCHVKKDV